MLMETAQTRSVGTLAIMIADVSALDRSYSVVTLTDTLSGDAVAVAFRDGILGCEEWPPEALTMLNARLMGPDEILHMWRGR